TFLHPSFLHVSSSNNPQGVVSNGGKISFHPQFSIKDVLGFRLMFLPLLTLPAY
ncbi:CYB protein, partial [Scytalopus superciliaris]|nr:CYB protein [Scytalopus superciliaris]